MFQYWASAQYWHFWYAQYRNTYTHLVNRLVRKLGQHEPLSRHRPTYRTIACLCRRLGLGSWDNLSENVSHHGVYTILSISLPIDAQFAKATFTVIVHIVMLNHLVTLIVLACSQCASRTEAPSNGLRKYHRRERTEERTNPHSHVDFLNVIID